MATLFEPSLSASAVRAPLSSADAPSMADTLPPIDFGFEELRERMAKFSDKFDAFIARGRKRVLEERNQFKINIAELQDNQKMKSRDLEILAHKNNQHDQSLQQQDAETAEMEHAISDLTSQKEQAAAHRSDLKTQIETIRSEIAARQSAQSAHSHGLDAQSRLNIPELDFWESHLGMRIEGVGKVDRLRFVFVNLDERDWAREAWFELDTEKREYAVVEYRPKVDSPQVDECVERLNSSRDLGVFLRGMRSVFKEAWQ